MNIKDLNKLEKKEINLLFKLFLKFQCSYWFNWMKDIIYSKNNKVHIYKYENIDKNIIKIKKILSLDNERIKFGKVKLKTISINSKLSKNSNLIKMILN